MRTTHGTGVWMIVTLAFVAGCGDFGTVDILWPDGPGCDPCDSDQAHIVVSPSVVELESGDSVRLSAAAYDARGTIVPGVPLTWWSGDTAVAVVNNAGWLFARVPGTASVFARAAGYFDGGTAVAVELGDADLGPGLTFTSIDAGATHTCALSADGAAWCWGSGTSGQLGIGRVNAERWTPTRVESDIRWRSLTLGGLHSCGLDVARLAWCWGANWLGQLGTGESEHETRPRAVSGGEAYSLLDAGAITTCALRDTGRVRCWGSDYGHYGNGQSTPGSPHPVDAAGTHVFAELGVGFDHACALAADGRVLCWGSDNRRVGSISTAAIATPTPVSSAETFTHLAVGSSFTCALDADGATYCWGTVAEQEWPVPTRIATAERFASIVVGGDHACALAADGRAFCWGLNIEGQLGTGGAASSASPVPVAGAHRFAALTAGVQHTCGLTTDGVAYCWGWNVNGQLGIGTRRGAATPARVARQ